MSDVTVQEIFGTVLPEKLEGNEKAQSVDAIYQFNIEGDDGGTWTVDLKTDSDFVSEGEADDPDCTITMKSEDFVNLWTGKLKGPQAFMMGKLKIKGNTAVAMKLQSFIG